jgi:hypothetical protein
MRLVLENFALPNLPSASFEFRAFRHGVAPRRRSWFASFPLFPLNDWPAVLREGLLVPLEKIS